MDTISVVMRRIWRPVWFALFLASLPALRSATIIYPVAAIEDFWNLGAAEFRQRYPGINASGLGPSDEGWYVRYKHENLTFNGHIKRCRWFIGNQKTRL